MHKPWKSPYSGLTSAEQEIVFRKVVRELYTFLAKWGAKAPAWTGCNPDGSTDHFGLGYRGAWYLILDGTDTLGFGPKGGYTPLAKTIMAEERVRAGLSKSVEKQLAKWNSTENTAAIEAKYGKGKV